MGIHILYSSHNQTLNSSCAFSYIDKGGRFCGEGNTLPPCNQVGDPGLVNAALYHINVTKYKSRYKNWRGFICLVEIKVRMIDKNLCGLVRYSCDKCDRLNSARGTALIAAIPYTLLQHGLAIFPSKISLFLYFLIIARV